MKLAAIVCRDRAVERRVTGDQALHRFPDLLLGASRELCDLNKAGLALHEGQDAGLAAPQHGVDLPVSHATPVQGSSRAFRDRTLAGQSSAAVIVAVALSPFLERLAKVRVEIPAISTIVPDVLVDRFMADREELESPQHSGHLLWAELPLQQLPDDLPLIHGELGLLASPSSATSNHLTGMECPVFPIGRVGIAPDLTGNRARTSAQLSSNRSQAEFS